MKLNIKELKSNLAHNKKFIFVSLILWIVVSCFMFLAYKEEWYEARIQSKYGSYFEKTEDTEEASITLTNGMEFVQNIRIADDEFTGLALRLNVGKMPEDGTITVELLKKNSGDVIGNWTKGVAEVPVGVFWELGLNERIYNEKDDEYLIRLVMAGVPEQVGIEMSLTSISNTMDVRSFVDGIESAYAIEYKVIVGNYNSLRFFALALYLAMSVAIFSVTFMFLKNARLEWMFAVFTMVIGGIYLFALPPYSVPDEPAHFLTAYAQSSVLLGRDVLDEEGRVIVGNDFFWGGVDGAKIIPTKDSYQQFMLGALGRGTKNHADKVVTSIKPLEMRHPGYLPQVIGVTLGRMLGVNCEQLLLMGRFFALIWYVFIMFWAMKLMPFGKMVLFVVGTLPMTLQMAVSYNYDSVLFGVCFFLVAYLFHLIYRGKKVGWKEILILCCLTTVIAAIKFVYLPILGLAFGVPKEKFGSKKKKVFVTILVVGIGMIVLLYLKLATIQNAAMPLSSMPGAKEGFSLEYVIKNPRTIFNMFWRTLRIQMPFYIFSMVATPLGWLEIGVPSIVVHGFFVTLIGSGSIQDNEGNWLKATIRFLGCVMVLMMIAMIFLALLLGWTAVGGSIIDGVQGRYFLPMLPLIIVLLHNRTILFTKNTGQYLILFQSFLQCITVYYISIAIIAR